jgi:mRNA degradation ribonuclease J1/J2
LDVIIDGLGKNIRKTVEGSNGNLEKEIIQSVKSYLYQEAKRSPFVFVTVNKV